MLGIENLRSAIGTVIAVAKSVNKSLADDGKISGWEWMGIGMKSLGFIKVVTSAKEILAEYKDLDEDERTDLNVWFKEEFDITNDNLELLIEELFDALLSLGNMFTKVEFN